MIRVLSAIFNTRTYIIQGHQYLISIIHLRECYFVLSDFSSPIRLFLGRPFHSFFSIINTQYSIIFKFYKKQAKVRENKIIAFFKKRILQFERLNSKRQYYIISYNLTWFFFFFFSIEGYESFSLQPIFFRRKQYKYTYIKQGQTCSPASVSPQFCFELIRSLACFDNLGSNSIYMRSQN